MTGLRRIMPCLGTALPFAGLAAMPVAPGWPAFGAGAVLALAFAGVAAFAAATAAWAGDDRWGVAAAMRSAAQFAAFFVPLALAAASMVLALGTLDLQAASARQARGTAFGSAAAWIGGPLSWGLLRQPPFTLLAFGIFCAAAMGLSNRAPFDAGERRLSDRVVLVLLSALGAALFLGGWLPPYGERLRLGPAEGAAWFVAKAALLAFGLSRLEGRWPRLRSDQLTSLGWKALTPVALANLVVIGILESRFWA